MYGYYLSLAWRRCCRHPASAILIAITLAVGIAACMTTGAIFAAFQGEAVPGVSSHLYVVTMDAREAAVGNHASYTPDSLLRLRDVKALVGSHPAAIGVGVAKSHVRTSSPDGKRPQWAHGLLAYGPVLKVLGVPLVSGRAWTRQELNTRAPVVVVGSQLAKRLFGTADVVGRSVLLEGHAFRVIGVTGRWKPRMPLIQVDESGPWNMQLFVPAGAALDAGVGPLSSGECGHSAVDTTFGSVDVAHCRWMEVWMALETSSAVRAFRRFATAYANDQHAVGRFIHPPRLALYRARAWIALNGVVPGEVSLNMVLGTAFLVLCMTNVIGLLTARFLRWHTDAVVRRALGASRRQLLVQHLLESALLGVLGGVLALPLTLFGMWIVRMQPVSYAAAARFSPGTFVALLALSIIVGIVVGVFPAWRICSLPPALQIKQE